VLFVHQNFPAQFGQIAAALAQRPGYRATFVSRRPPGLSGGVERIQYHLKGGATARSHYCSRTFENAVWHAHGVYEALGARPDIRPDLVVGHSGFGSTLFLRELESCACPMLNYFEYYYHTHDSDMDFRPEFPPREIDRLRARSRNAMILLDLENCDAGYAPTGWQRSRLPARYHDKLRVIFDGVDTSLWRPAPARPLVIGGQTLPGDVPIVTYVARGLEAMRGFDVFMKMAKLLCERRRDVQFVVVGSDRVCYGNDLRFTGGKTFKEWVLARDEYDLTRFLFTGLIPPQDLAGLLSSSALHVYLTVPFVLSWSLFNALACGATVLASDVAPVREVITHGQTGLLTPFSDVEAMARQAEQVLDVPGDYRHLGESAIALVHERYSLDVCLPQLLELYHETARGRGAGV
jgi:glycosyltransferase involved in cell wall biosynthesis